MTKPDSPTERVYYVVEMTVPYRSLAQVQAQAPEALAEHVNRSTELHRAGDVLMAGAFLQPDPQAGDPFVRDGTVLAHRVRAWANMFAR